MKRLNFLRPLFAALALTLFVACDDDNNDNDDGTSRVRISMTDAPGDYEEVNVEVIGVQWKETDDTGEENWVDVPNINGGIINLLDLTGGVTVLLADNEIPSGHLGQIRLLLGDENTVVKNGVTYELNTPSAQQSGLKLQVDTELEPDITYNFLLDFDVEQSVVEAGGSGNYNLHPVIRVTTEAASGSISGTVTSTGLPVMASVTVGTSVVSAYSDENGTFHLHGIPAGIYNVLLTPTLESGLTSLTVENVTVVNGETTALGAISL